MNGKKLLLLGGGGHCKSVLDCVLSAGEYEKIGIVVNAESDPVLGVPVVGTDNDLPSLLQDGWTDAFVTVGSLGSTVVRRKLYALLKENGFNVPHIIAPEAVIARDVNLSEGVFVGKNAVVNTGSVLGCCAIINSGAVIEHDCRIGDFSHVCPGSTLCGQVNIGADTHIGAGSIIRQSITVGKNVMIGIGSIVVKDIPDCVKAYGNPCKVV